MTLNPAAGGREISDAVALVLVRKWELRATKLRNGNAIKRWTLWLEPYRQEQLCGGPGRVFPCEKGDEGPQSGVGQEDRGGAARVGAAGQIQDCNCEGV